MGASCGPLSVSATSRCSIEMAGRSELNCGMEAYFDQSYAMLYGNASIYNNKRTSLWNIFLNSARTDDESQAQVCCVSAVY